MDTAAPVIQAVGLTKVYKDFWRRPKVKALDDLSFDLRPGEVFGLLGPNGSGKSTTIKLFLGLLFPTRGRVTVFGRNPRDVRVKQRIGFMPEETYLYPYLTAEETLEFFARIFGLPPRERRKRVDSLIKMVGLTGARKRPLSEFSKGMARRIGLAQALIGDPDLLLLDEPTTGLDPIGTREVKDLIIELRARGKTILLSSHLLADVEDICDRVAILYGGKLRCIGSVNELLEEKHVTQITAEDIDEATVQSVLDVIRQRAGEVPVEVGHPIGSLENFFLGIVRRAQQEQVGTSGAVSGEVRSAFMMEGARSAAETPAPSPGEVIGKLTAREAPAPKPAPGAAAETDEERTKAKREVLGRLLEKKDKGKKDEGNG